MFSGIHKCKIFFFVQFSIINYQIGARTTPSNGTFGDKFSEQQQHHSTKKSIILMPNLHFFRVNKVHILIKTNNQYKKTKWANLSHLKFFHEIDS